MANEKISILVEAVDKSSGVLDGIGSAFSSLGGIALGVAAGGIAAFGAAVVSGIGDAKESRLLMAQTEQVIKTMGNSAGVSAQHVVDLASSLSDAAGKSLFGDDQIQASTNMLLTFGNIKGETLDLATALTVDMGQALKKTPEDMSVMVGKLLNSADAMSAAQRMGVSFTDQQLAMGKAMFESGDIAGYQKLVLEELNHEFGGQAAAAAAATGGWSQFTGRLGEAKETLGAALLPALNLLAGALNQYIMPAVEALAAEAIPALTAAWQSVQPGFQFISDNAGPIAAALAAMGVTILISLIPPFVAWATAAGAAAIATITALAPVVVPIVAIGAAAALLASAWDSDWGGIRTALTAFWTGTGAPIFNTLKTWLDTTLTGAIQSLSNFWTGTLQPALNSVWSFLNSYVIPLLVALADVYLAALQRAVGAAATFWTGTLKPAFAAVSGFIKDDVSPILGSLAKVLTDTLTPAWQGFEGVLSTVSGWIGGLGSIISRAIGWLHDLAEAIRGTPSAPSGAPGFASGVRNFSGGLALVGERGPELVALPRGANVYSNGESRSMLAGAGGGTVQNYFQSGAIVVYGAAGQNADQLADKVLDRIQNRVNSRRTA